MPINYYKLTGNPSDIDHGDYEQCYKCNKFFDDADNYFYPKSNSVEVFCDDCAEKLRLNEVEE
jgi:hypothetical protein